MYITSNYQNNIINAQSLQVTLDSLFYMIKWPNYYNVYVLCIDFFEIKRRIDTSRNLVLNLNRAQLYSAHQDVAPPSSNKSIKGN